VPTPVIVPMPTRVIMSVPTRVVMGIVMHVIVGVPKHRVVGVSAGGVLGTHDCVVVGVFVRVAVVAGAWVGLAHGAKRALKVRLQHVNNNVANAIAKGLLSARPTCLQVSTGAYPDLWVSDESWVLGLRWAGRHSSGEETRD
jgi:hypothetical protein